MEFEKSDWSLGVQLAKLEWALGENLMKGLIPTYFVYSSFSYSIDIHSMLLDDKRGP